MAEKAEAWLKEAGAIRTWKKLPGKGMSGGQHQAGTCRMGDDPQTSVVDSTAAFTITTMCTWSMAACT